MARTVVLDAPALMALIRGEAGAEMVSDSLSCAVVSAVNQAEVQAMLVSAGLEKSVAWWHIAEVRCESVPFDEEQARLAGSLLAMTRPYGLSLGDRACLALAIQRGGTVYTTDQAWKSLPLDIGVEVIR